ncbi:MBL fold metallo-hydrolase [Streptomyces sp. NBC_00053]|uniref:MBL fold metallo-hydrolase n=1 Tax=unclassified Streptomyces TaxID=2593676 RepID=UPI000F5C2416|nr:MULTISPECIES: MBL fold metallo-hydrolase [unclassified Streptomyces]WSG51927.1 MBL fold metallo-hydrolase [Streptomyces sp. NBC_01732]WSX02583.1 MBL fold metallo-hydrolase [Streptomyces sp. NBC_00987]MCX4395497.1 MBL fold metallo-hydrolase [Streptomyces sp. NBC_01767]MCX5101873.1 MBL fold metallo-hydrolase [Streptomyces sp. NBC_00439]MCX5161391.1 MBL fold metallo-hydrolase [Streptomyces sp. NBC_00305]
MRVTRVQHTCFVFDTEDGRVVVDPALDYFGNLWSPRGRNRMASQLLAGVSAVVITHSHSDHFHLPTLLHFDRKTPIAVPSSDRSTDFPMAAELADYGFTNVIEIEPMQAVRLAGIDVTSVPAPDSIEGIPQQSLLLERGDLRILHGADTLEDFDALEEIAHERPIRIAMLPLNCSLNYQNLRNQMSPGTFLEAARILQPEAMVPLGVNEGPRRGITATDVPWFPHGEALYRDRAFIDAHPEGSRLLAIEDGQSLQVCESTPLGAVDSLAEATDNGSSDVEIALGRFWSLLIDVHVRDRYYFGLVRDWEHEQWRDAWLECRSRFEELLADWDKVLLGAVEGLPGERVKAPVLRYFPRTVGRLTSQGDSLAQLVLDSLWLLEPGLSEQDYVQALYGLLAARVRSDPSDLWHCRREYSGWLQARHKRKRPALPRGFDENAADRWLRRQAAADRRSADYVHPRINPIFGPFDVAGVPSLNGGPSQDGPVLALHTLRHRDGRAQSVATVLRGAEARLAEAVVQADGTASISELCDRLGLPTSDFEQFQLRLGDFDPYCLEGHWYPSEALAWRPDFRA